VVVPICDPALTTCSSFELRVQADMNGTQLVADVLGYFERFPKEVVKTFSRIDFGDAATPAIAGTCTHVTGTAVTLTATAAGRITVRGLLVGTLGHVQAAGDESLFTFVGTSPTDCAANSSAHALPSAAASGTYGVTVPVLRFFDVTPGTYTYYLNAFVGGAGGGAAADSATAAQSNIEATFVPN
jgi:hypothetical protein